MSHAPTNLSTLVSQVAAAPSDAPVMLSKPTKKRPLAMSAYKGVLYVDGLFAMHDRFGFHLADSVILCRKSGAVPCVKQFVEDAVAAGWKRERAERVAAEAMKDANL